MNNVKIKVGIVSCSGEGIPEGTVSRLACRKVLDDLRPGITVTICLPLFIAGGEEERRFTALYVQRLRTHPHGSWIRSVVSDNRRKMVTEIHENVICRNRCSN